MGRSLCLCILLLCAAGSAFAAPAGLNLIPTADVYEPGQVSLEYQSDCNGRPFGGQQARYSLLQVGLVPGLEFGVDKCINDGEEPLVANVKYRLKSGSGSRPAFAVGVQNVGGGQVCQPYAVGCVGMDRALRGHFGAIAIDGAVKGLLGVDYTWKRWILQGDWVSGRDNAAGIGVSFDVGAGIYVTYSLFLPNMRGGSTVHSINLQRLIALK